MRKLTARAYCATRGCRKAEGHDGPHTLDVPDPVVLELRRAAKRALVEANYLRRWADEQVSKGNSTVIATEYQRGWARGYHEMAKVLERRATRLERAGRKAVRR